MGLAILGKVQYGNGNPGGLEPKAPLPEESWVSQEQTCLRIAAAPSHWLEASGRRGQSLAAKASITCTLSSQRSKRHILRATIALYI